MQSRSSSSVKIFYPKLSRAEVISRLKAGLKELQQKLPIVRAVLFGSYAQGRYTVSSDIDLLIVYAGPARPDAYTLVKRSLELPRVEPHLYTQAEYEQLSETLRKMTEGGIVLVDQHRTSKRVQLVAKRLLDIVFSVVGLALLAIPFALIALAIKLDSKGPVFFKHERVGKDGKRFICWKFRTMIEGAINQGLGVTVAQDDPRITRVGRFLRNWGLDELPQLINVLKGEMSLVGPRPTFPYQVERYTAFQRRRLEVKPGITGWALVNGRNRLPWEERIKLDVWYVDHWSLWLDFKILLKTLWVVLVTHEGLYGEGGVNDDLRRDSQPQHYDS
ncbi:MAG: exopolysaccharide biosynthesis polyprenyl glycosylphosphotransferase [Candidatus Bipolaricaulota bacterium]|nr:exopolysaccharide biosynthesis polyprenyl glycosylphosphotransferase [Candidatus Bipolaricaulota bacterium]